MDAGQGIWQEGASGTKSVHQRFLNAGGMSVAEILGVESLQMMPRMNTPRTLKQHVPLQLPFSEQVLSEAWVQLPPPCRSTLEACIAAYAVSAHVPACSSVLYMISFKGLLCIINFCDFDEGQRCKSGSQHPGGLT